MEENRARRVVDALRARGVDARMQRAAVYQFGIWVKIPGGREAVWDSDGTAGLEAQVMRNGILVGFVVSIPGSETFGEAQVADAIATADYDAPIGRSRPVSSGPVSGSPPRPAPASLAQRLRGAFRG